MLADGGECVSDLGAVREQEALFGSVASDSTAFRMVEKIASTPGMLDALRQAHARARERFWELDGAPERLTIDVDATLITAHSEKEQATGNYKHGYGFHPLGAYADETREALAMILRPGNAGSNTAADHKAVIDLALAQIPAEQIENIEILIRADSAGATHETADHCHGGNLRFSLGYELTETVRSAIVETPENAWVPALDQDGSERENGEVVEITERLDLSTWPQGSRLIVRRERPHPGAQLSFTDHDGYRFQAILTDQTDPLIAIIERRHRQRARVEDRIRDDKDTGLAKLRFKAFALNEVWLEIVMLAHDLIVWTQALVLDGELAKAEPNGCATGFCTSPPDSRSPDAAQSCTYPQPGHGPRRSRLRSRSSRRSRPPPADHHPPRHHPRADPRPPAAITAEQKPRRTPTDRPERRAARTDTAPDRPRPVTHPSKPAARSHPGTYCTIRANSLRGLGDCHLVLLARLLLSTQSELWPGCEDRCTLVVWAAGVITRLG